MSFSAILASQVDAKSPIDDSLMELIKANFDDHESRLLINKTFDYEFKVNGPLINLPSTQRKRLDGAMIARAQTFTRCRLYLENPGTTGTLEVDVRKYQRPNTPITQLSRQFSSTIDSISQIAPALATQSITRATSQIATQSVSRWKSAINVESIILLGSNLVRYNLASAPDSDWAVGDSVTFASCTNAANNVTVTIVRLKDDGGNNVVVTNAAGVAQTGAAGTCSLDAWSYNFSNPVSSQFTAGEAALFASHTSGGNDGTLTIYAINQSGNNIIVKNSSGVAQAGVAGNVNVQRFVYSFSTSASSTDFVVGEKMRAASHTTGANNGDFTITAVNSGGNNVVVYNSAGTTQGGVAGTVNTCRWVYALPTSPSSSFSAGQSCVVASATTAANNGTFTVKEVNRSGTNNIVVYNTSGVAQVGAAGTLVHSRMLVKFASDQSAVYTTSSRIEIINTVSSANVDAFDVVEVNRGGGSNYNVVVEMPSGVEQASPCGRVHLESKSIFTTKPSLALNSNVSNVTDRHMQYDEDATFNANATVVAGDIIAMDITSVPSGNPTDVVVQLV